MGAISAEGGMVRIHCNDCQPPGTQSPILYRQPILSSAFYYPMARFFPPHSADVSEPGRKPVVRCPGPRPRPGRAGMDNPFSNKARYPTMATSVIEICNNALLDLGEDVIMSLDRRFQARRAVQPPLARRARRRTARPPLELRHDPGRTGLGHGTNAPLWKWEYKYALPTDFLRVIQVGGPGRRTHRGLGNPGQHHPVRRGGSHLHLLRPLRDRPPAGTTPCWWKTLSARLAAALAYPLTGSTSLAQAYWEIYKQTSSTEARGVDAREGVPESVSPDHLARRETARVGGRCPSGPEPPQDNDVPCSRGTSCFTRVGNWQARPLAHLEQRGIEKLVQRPNRTGWSIRYGWSRGGAGPGEPGNESGCFPLGLRVQVITATVPPGAHLVRGVLQNFGLEQGQVGQVRGLALPLGVRPPREHAQAGAGQVEQDRAGLVRGRGRGRVGHERCLHSGQVAPERRRAAPCCGSEANTSSPFSSRMRVLPPSAGAGVPHRLAPGRPGSRTSMAWRAANDWRCMGGSGSSSKRTVPAGRAKLMPSMSSSLGPARYLRNISRPRRDGRTG